MTARYDERLFAARWINGRIQVRHRNNIHITIKTSISEMLVNLRVYLFNPVALLNLVFFDASDTLSILPGMQLMVTGRTYLEAL